MLAAVLLLACPKTPEAQTAPPLSVALPRPELVAPPVRTVTYTVQPGETRTDFARWSGQPVDAIAASSPDELQVGGTVRLALDDAGVRRVERAREAHHAAVVDRWLDRHGGKVGLEVHEVGRGETASAIARAHRGMPLLVVARYNAGTDLDRLEVGQRLVLPVTADQAGIAWEEIED